MSEPASDRPWWADVEHLQPSEGDAGAPPRPAKATGRFARRPGWTTATATEAREHAEPATIESHGTAETAATAEPRRPRVDFDFDAGIASLLDAPPEPRGRFEWIDLSGDDTGTGAEVDWLALEEAATTAPRPLDERRTKLSADDRASGWRSDVWDDPKPAAVTPARRRPASTRAQRLAGSPDRLALYAFLLGLLLIALAAIGAPQADAAVALVAETQ